MAFAENRANAVFAFALSGVFACVSVASALVLKALVDTAVGGDLPDLSVLILVSIGYMAVYLAASFLSARMSNTFIARAIANLRDALIAAAMSRRDSLRDGDASSAYLNLFTHDLSTAERDRLKNLIAAPQHAFMLLCGIGVMIVLDPVIFGALAVAAALAVGFMGLSGRRLPAREQRLSEANAQFSHRVKDLVSGLYTIRSYQSEFWVARRLRDDSAELGRASLAALSGRERTRIVAEFSTYFVVLAVLGVGVAQTILGNTTIGTLFAYIQLLNYVVVPMQLLPQEIAGLRTSRASMARIGFAIEGRKEHSIGEITPAPDSPTVSIALTDVSYRYPSADRDAVADLSYRFSAGRSYAIVGSSGSGKSTLLKLLQGFDLSYSGDIEFGDVELRDASEEYVARHLGVVHQDVYIFDATLRDNITVFRSYEESAIRDAAVSAGLEELVDRLGWDHPCGEHGQTLSGGEKQRVGIARAFLRNSSVMLFDEITSSLDNKTSRSIESTVARWGTATRIVVTHRLDEESMRAFDTILMFRSGRLVEEGTFDELIARGGEFREMYEHPNAGERTSSRRE